MSKEYDSPSALELLKVVLGSMLGDFELALHELSRRSTSSEEDLAGKAWLLYLGTLAFDAARGALALLEANNPRAANTLQRQLYEYTVRAKYTLSQADVALLQFRARKGRHFARLTKLDLQSQLREDIEQTHAEWQKANPGVGETDGAAKFSRMKDAVDDDRRYLYYYEIPSLLVHGDVIGFMDVFNEDEYPQVQFTMQSRTIKPEACAATVAMFVMEWCRIFDAGGIGMDTQRYDEQLMNAIRRVASEWRLPPDVFPTS